MDLKLPRDFDPARADEILQRVRPALDLPDDTQLRAERVNHTAQGTEIQFSASVPMRLDAPTAKAGGRLIVDIHRRGVIQFDANGNLTRANVEPPDQRQVAALQDNVQKLVAANQVYFAKPGEAIDPDKLRAQGKSWYTQQDERGYLRLERAYIA